jgi:MFS transporter, DHA2 family, multidrug resistance protein
LRNIGGSIGISVVNTIVLRHSQLHRAELVHRITPGRLSSHQSLQGLQHFFAMHGAGAALGLQRAYALISQSLDQQARLWSYVDDFRYMALACFLCIPLVFALKKTVGKGAAGLGH